MKGNYNYKYNIIITLVSKTYTFLYFFILKFSGIGVDDMFVIVETWKNLLPEEAKVDIPLKLALTLSRSGVSITVTSITDIVAFGIGASTVSPIEIGTEGPVVNHAD